MWAFGYGGIMRQTFNIYQQMRKKIPHLLIPMSSWGGGGGNMVFNEKPTKKLKLRGLKLRGLRQNQISTRYLTCENDRRNQINTLGDS